MEKVFFANKKGQKLAGLFFDSPSNAASTAVIVCHGFTGSKEGQGKAVKMAEFLSEKGYTVFLFDFTGCGESEGSFEDISLSGQISDLECAISFCQDRGLRRFITLGRSFGGTTAICQAPADPRVVGVCTWAAPRSIFDLFLGFTDGDLPENDHDVVLLAGADGIVRLRKHFFTDLLLYDVGSCSALISPRPLLVVQGTADSVVPPEDASGIFDSAGVPRDQYFIEGADHQFSDHHSMLWNLFADWAGKHF